MRESNRARKIEPSLTRKLFNMAQQIGNDVIDLTLGDPDLPTPEEIRTAACQAIMEGKTRYSANAGLLPLRECYAEHIAKEYGLTVSPQKNVIATVGGMEALFLTIMCTVNEGDEVIILEPYYVNYHQMLNMCGGVAVPVNHYGKTSEAVASELCQAITPRTVGIILNTPCNPTGEVISGQIIDTICQLAKEHDLFVVSDEVYSSLIYDGKKHDSILTRPDMADRTILIDSCSKRFAMTGWRIGFAVGPEDVIANMTKMQENVAACAPLPAQYAAIRAFQSDFDYSYIQKEYEARRNFIVSRLEEIPVLSFKKPEATFYCFVNVSRTGLDAEQFAYKLLEEQHVAVVPGLTYGKNYTDYVRIAFTLHQDKLAEAMRRIKVFCEGLK